MLMRSLLLCALVFTSANITAKVTVIKDKDDWKKISVIKSTRADVVALLGLAKKDGYEGNDYSDLYPVEGGTVIFNYSQGYCNLVWNVPEWTVTEIDYNLIDSPLQFSSLNIDLSKFTKNNDHLDGPNVTSYISEDAGIGYDVDEKGLVETIKYFPAKKYNYLLCQEHLNNARAK